MLAFTSFDEDSANEFAREYERVFYAADHEALASVYGENARLIGQGMDVVEGRPAIAQFWKQACAGARAIGLKRSIHHDVVQSSGDMGYLQGRVLLEIPSGAETARITSRYLALWRREPDGIWRIAVDISNTDVSPETGKLAYGVSQEQGAAAER
jgi:ketosteroid isomerase-like protein